ncbi:MAG: hypothetical protein AB1742_07325, partial [bacterium]
DRDLIFLDGRRIYVLSLAGRPPTDFPRKSVLVQRKALALVMLGFQVHVTPESEHFFRLAEIDVERRGPLRHSGTPGIGWYPSLLLSPLSPADRYAVGGERIRYY